LFCAALTHLRIWLALCSPPNTTTTCTWHQHACVSLAIAAGVWLMPAQQHQRAAQRAAASPCSPASQQAHSQLLHASGWASVPATWPVPWHGLHQVCLPTAAPLDE
jgi:hypothetical protein